MSYSNDTQAIRVRAGSNLVSERTPARLLVGRAGASYLTATQLEMRGDHAAARDAVHAELSRDFLARMQLVETQSCARTRAEFLLRPDLGRRLDELSRARILELPAKADLQVVIGDGLSATAVETQTPMLLPRLLAEARQRGWSLGVPFAVRCCRVGILNDVGDLLQPDVVVLLIGERPGLATAESLSVYMAYRPRPGHTDAQRNLISNIHQRGIGHADAVCRILALAEAMRQLQASGVSVKEEMGPLPGMVPDRIGMRTGPMTGLCLRSR